MLVPVKPSARSVSKGVGLCQSYGCEVCDDADATQCVTCFDGFTKNSDNTCTCPSGAPNWAATQCLACSSGSFYSSFLKRCVNCASNCSACSDTLTCTTCDVPYTLDNGLCVCSGFTDNNKNCVVCGSGAKYFDGSACQDCSSNCDACSTPSGQCTTCASTFQIQSDGTCACATGYYVGSSGSCIQATVQCGTGQYNNGQDVCTTCGENCDACADFTGECTTCTDGMQ
jgi:hypothetical protein